MIFVINAKADRPSFERFSLSPGHLKLRARYTSAPTPEMLLPVARQAAN